MPRRIVILDAVASVFLTLLSLNFLLFFGLQGGAALEQLLPDVFAGWSEVTFIVLLAIVTGTTIHLLGAYNNAVGLLFGVCLWVILAVGFVFGILPSELTVQVISWKILAFSFPLIYLYGIRKRKFRMYFQICAWVYTLATLGLVVRSLATGSSALTGAAGVIPFILTAFFVSVSIYLAYRLIAVR